MRQVIYDRGGGKVRVVDAPQPQLGPGAVLVGVEFSLISSGTERSKLHTARQSLAGKAMSRPDLVRQVLAYARDEGVRQAYEKVRDRLSEPAMLGYSAAGTVLAVGEGVSEFRPGERVACAGAGSANHAEVIAVPKNLAVPLPAGLPARDGAFAAVGAIALHGFRQSAASLGETVGVVGLGLVGQLVAQVARSAGCRVVGTDLDPARVELALELGMDEVLAEPDAADHVIICAASKSREPLARAIKFCRDRGRLVIIGDLPIEADRERLYRKELSLVLSRSYGPGRYDDDYELAGHDYPRAYVRWTEQRNLQAFLELVASGAIKLAPLVSGEFAADAAPAAYAAIEAGGLAVLLAYQPQEDVPAVTPGHAAVPGAASGRAADSLGVGFVGAGSFARGRLIPAVDRTPGVHVVGLTTATGLTAAVAAASITGSRAFPTMTDLIAEADPAAVVIATRHASHAALTLEAAAADRYVFVEKPLALHESELRTLRSGLTGAQQERVMVGFNRRFAPATRALRRALADRRGPAMVLVRVNGGFVPRDHWTQGPEGGGRIRGEACHFIDLVSFLTGSRVTTVSALGAPNGDRYLDDNVGAVISLEDGSVGTLLYTAAGNRGAGKELVEVHWDGHSAVIDDFRQLRLSGSLFHAPAMLGRRDKGHREAIGQFLEAVKHGRPTPISFESSVNATLATLALEASLRAHLVYEIGDDCIYPA